MLLERGPQRALDTLVGLWLTVGGGRLDSAHDSVHTLMSLSDIFLVDRDPKGGVIGIEGSDICPLPSLLAMAHIP